MQEVAGVVGPAALERLLARLEAQQVQRGGVAGPRQRFEGAVGQVARQVDDPDRAEQHPAGADGDAQPPTPIAQRREAVGAAVLGDRRVLVLGLGDDRHLAIEDPAAPDRIDRLVLQGGEGEHAATDVLDHGGPAGRRGEHVHERVQVLVLREPARASGRRRLDRLQEQGMAASPARPAGQLGDGDVVARQLGRRPAAQDERRGPALPGLLERQRRVAPAWRDASNRYPVEQIAAADPVVPDSDPAGRTREASA